MTDAVRAFGVVHLDERGPTSREERVAHEEPLEIRVNGASLAVLMRTPGCDEELVRGFLITERVCDAAAIESVRHCTTVPDPEAEDNVIDVRLRVPFDLERHRRHTFASSSCGVCGKATIENACAVAPKLDDVATIRAATIAAMPAKLRAAQPAFDETGGVHGVGLFSLAGDLVVAREDVGRHNAVDKVVGVMSLRALDPAGHALFVSGRVSFEIVQKAAAARVPIVAGISAPTSLAVRIARALGVTVAGFVRGAAMNLYAGEQRIVPE